MPVTTRVAPDGTRFEVDTDKKTVHLVLPTGALRFSGADVTACLKFPTEEDLKQAQADALANTPLPSGTAFTSQADSEPPMVAPETSPSDPPPSPSKADRLAADKTSPSQSSTGDSSSNSSSSSSKK